MVGILIAVEVHIWLVGVAGGWCMCMNRFPRIHFKHIPFRQAQNAPMRRRRRSTAPAENATSRWSMKLTFIPYTVSPIGDAWEGGSGLRRHMWPCQGEGCLCCSPAWRGGGPVLLTRWRGGGGSCLGVLWQRLCLTWAVLLTNEFCQVGGKGAGSCAFASFVAVQALFMSGKGVWRSTPLRRGMKE